MKRLITLILSVLILVSGVCGALLAPASALSDAQSKNYFENPENWMLFDEAVTNISSPLTNTWATVKNASVNVGNETVDALELHALNHRAAIYLPNLKKNTEYSLSFKYYSPNLGNEGYIFKDMVMFTPDFANAKIAWNYDTPNGVKEYVSYNGYYIWDDTYSSATTYWDESHKTISGKAGQWNTYSITFNTGNYENYASVLLCKVMEVYLKDFILTEKEVPVEEYFANTQNWMLFDEAVTNISSPLTNTWATVKNASVNVGNETVDALELHALNHRAAIYLPNLKKNTEYTFSFKYYTESPLTEGYIFKDIVLFNPDFANAKIAWNYDTPNGVKEYVSYNGYYIWDDTYSSTTKKWDESDTTKAAKVGEWNTYTITFNTGNYDKYATVILSKVMDVYLKDFTLTEKAVPVEEYFADTKNWMLFNESATSIANPLINTWATVNNSSVTVGAETTNALHLFALNHRVAIYLPALKKNTDYTFSFKYYSPNLGSEGYIFKDIVFFNPDFANAKIAWNYDTPNGVKEYVSYNGYYIWNTNYSSANAKWDVSATTKAAKAGEWNTYTITFNTGNYESYAPVLLPKVENVYLSDFTLVDNSTPDPKPDPEPDPKPELKGEGYFEEVSNWVIDDYVDKSQEANATIGFLPSTSRKITLTDFVTNSSTAALKIEANNGFTSIALPDDLKENTDYTLSFTYYFDNADIQNLGGGAKGVFDRYGIYAADAPNACFKWSSPGFLHYISYNGSYLTKDFTTKEWTGYVTAVEEGGKWIKVDIPFNTVNFKKLAFVFQTKTNVVYMDNITLSEGLPEKETFHNGPKEQIVIDFEREWKYISGSNANRMEIAETTDKDGKPTKAIRIYEGDYKSQDGVTFLNWQSVNSGSDEVFSIPVKGGQTYEFSVDINLSAYSKENDQRLLLYADYATSTTLMQMIYYSEKNSGVGEGWKTYTYKFTVAEDAKVASFGLNAGLKHPEIWVDNLVLTESEPEPPFHNGKTDPIKIDFEREFEYTTGIHADRMEVTETIGMDGKKTKALHVFEGDYSDTNQVTFVNWSTVTTDSDPVFTIPVKPKTPYKFSVKVKIEDWKDVNYGRLFLFYYDYNNRGVSDKNLINTTYSKLMDQGWVEYELEFLTDANQTCMSLGINMGLSHPEIWIDDIVVDAYERGFIHNADASYVEDGFNLVEESQNKTNGTITKPSVLQIPVKEITKHTIGITASGNGNIKVAFDREGNEVIQNISLSNKNTRYGFEILTGENDEYIYIIFEPSGKGITYKDATVFASNATSFNTAMGLTEKPDNTTAKKPVFKYVDADDALENAGISLDDYESEDSESPQTGESNGIYVMLFILSVSIAVLWLFRKNNLKYE